MNTNHLDNFSSKLRKVSILELIIRERTRRLHDSELLDSDEDPLFPENSCSLQEIDRELQDLERRGFRTNLPEFLDGCHIFYQLRIQACFDNKSIQEASASRTPNPNSKNETFSPNLTDLRPRPERIRKWHDFLSQQKEIWDELVKSFTITKRQFFPAEYLDQVGDDVLEEDTTVNWRSLREIDKYQNECLISHVSHIIEKISQIPVIRESFCLKDTMFTSNDTNTLASERVAKKLKESPTIRPHNSSADDIKAIFRSPDIDQFCAYNHNESSNCFKCDLYSPRIVSIFIFEYKGAQKLKLEYISQGLHEMELDEIVTYGPNDGAREKCTQLVAAIITRTFAYMVQAGLEYGCIWTGEATIFLRIPEDPSTIFYHLSVPKYDVGETTGWSEASDSNNRLHLTTVGLMLAFTLQAARAQPRSNSWRLEALRRLKRWNVAYEDLLRSIPDLNDTPSKSPIDLDSGFDGIQVSYESPIRFQPQPIPTSLSCSGALDACNDYSSKTFTVEIPNQPNQSQSSSVSQGGGNNSSHENTVKLQFTGSNPGIQYCTHKCLRGLKFGGLLDDACPNSKEHGTQYHQISRSDFLEMIRRQLAENMNDDFKVIGSPGSRGAPLSVRLASHGYTVFAKCSPEWFAPCLLYEAKVYDRLESIQGIHIPVHLGNIDLDQPYLLNGFVMLFHVMFFSYGGSPVSAYTSAKDTAAITQQVEEAFEKIHQLNVLHRDVAHRNILVDPVTKQAVVTDFERSKLIEIPQDQVNTPAKEKKRKRSSDSGDEQIGELEMNATSPERKKRKVSSIDINSSIDRSSSQDSILDEDTLEEKFSYEMFLVQDKLIDIFYHCE